MNEGDSLLIHFSKDSGMEKMRYWLKLSEPDREAVECPTTASWKVKHQAKCWKSFI